MLARDSSNIQSGLTEMLANNIPLGKWLKRGISSDIITYDGFSAISAGPDVDQYGLNVDVVNLK